MLHSLLKSKITVCFCTMNKISFEANQTGEEGIREQPYFWHNASQQ